VEEQKFSYLGQGIYSAEFYVEEGKYQWKIASGNWEELSCGIWDSRFDP